jgi:hypothetical protein
LDFRNLGNSPPTISGVDRLEPRPADSAVERDGKNTAVDLGDSAVERDGKNTAVELGRLAWLGTVLVCLIVVLILVLQGYYGYAAVTFAVAMSAAINLL